MSGTGLWIKPWLSYLHKLKMLFPRSFSSIASFLFILAHGLTLRPVSQSCSKPCCSSTSADASLKNKVPAGNRDVELKGRPHLYLHYAILCLQRMLKASRWGRTDIRNSNEHELPFLQTTAVTGSALSSVTKECKPFLLQISMCIWNPDPCLPEAEDCHVFWDSFFLLITRLWSSSERMSWAHSTPHGMTKQGSLPFFLLLCRVRHIIVPWCYHCQIRW